MLYRLRIIPFEKKMKVIKVLQNGIVFDPFVLDIKNDAIISKFQKACETQASLSLGANFPTSASTPHSLLKGFMNLVYASEASGYEFK